MYRMKSRGPRVRTAPQLVRLFTRTENGSRFAAVSSLKPQLRNRAGNVPNVDASSSCQVKSFWQRSFTHDVRVRRNGEIRLAVTCNREDIDVANYSFSAATAADEGRQEFPRCYSFCLLAIDRDR